MTVNILQVKNLKTYFYTPRGIVRAVDDVSFEIGKGECFGLVGESGSGKTLTALSLLRVIPRQAKTVNGEALFNGADLLKMDEKELRSIRGVKISMVFQEVSASFNPVFTIGEQIIESIIEHQDGKRRPLAREIALEYLRKVRIKDPARIFHDYPHQLSGGTKQRAMIAMALVNSPRLVILDEPTTALDVTVQAEILDLLDEIIEKERLSILFISHDFGVIGRMCDRVAVMKSGRIVEEGAVAGIFSAPKHPYTVSLLESLKVLA